jgi:hypothetical protein
MKRRRFDPDWTCPFHDRRVRKISRHTGRRYIGCDRCHSFARLMTSAGLAMLLTDRGAERDQLPF